MKLKKYFTLSILFILMVCLVTGCFNRKELNAKEFSSLIVKEGFVVLDNTENYKELSGVKKYLVATNTLRSYKIEYYEFNDTKKAEELYDKIETKFKNSTKVKKSQYQTTSFGKYNYYSLTTDNSYKVVSRINKTVVITDSDRVNKESIKEVVKKLGY